MNSIRATIAMLVALTLQPLYALSDDLPGAKAPCIYKSNTSLHGQVTAGPYDFEYKSDNPTVETVKEGKVITTISHKSYIVHIVCNRNMDRVLPFEWKEGGLLFQRLEPGKSAYNCIPAANKCTTKPSKLEFGPTKQDSVMAKVYAEDQNANAEVPKHASRPLETSRLIAQWQSDVGLPYHVDFTLTTEVKDGTILITMNDAVGTKRVQIPEFTKRLKILSDLRKLKCTDNVKAAMERDAFVIGKETGPFEVRELGMELDGGVTTLTFVDERGSSVGGGRVFLYLPRVKAS